MTSDKQDDYCSTCPK
ncbi:hypothetical protein [Paenibacillus sanguinis]